MIPAHIEPVLKEDAQAYTKRLAGWPYAGFAPQADEWARRKYLFAKDIWPKRHAQCPGFKDKEGRAITWETRFKDMFLEPLAEYRARLHAAQTQVAA
jgi:hypothetical protein